MKSPSASSTLKSVASLCFSSLVLILLIYGRIVLSAGIALAIYSSEIQVMITFAGLSPIFVVLIESARREAFWVKAAALYGIWVLTVSAIGVAACLVEMGAQLFAAGYVFIPVIPAMGSYFLLARYLVALMAREGGWRESIQPLRRT